MKRDGLKTESTPNPSGKTTSTLSVLRQVRMSRWVGISSLIIRFCACLDGTKTFLFLVLVLVLQPCLKYFCREYTSSASSVKRHKFMLTTCTRLILFTLFYFCFSISFLFSFEGLAGKPFWRLECQAYSFLFLDGHISESLCWNFSPAHIIVQRTILHNRFYLLK